MTNSEVNYTMLNKFCDKLRDTKEKFLFQGGSEFALNLAEEIEDLQVKYEETPTEFDFLANKVTIDLLKKERDALRAALHEIAEEFAGSECGVPITAQEAYAVELARRMGRMAAEARDAAKKGEK